MDISFDPVKRAWTLENRGLDLADAELVFNGEVATRPDDRTDYGEERFITAGFLGSAGAGRMVVMVWTPRDGRRRIISMRHAHEDEQAQWIARGGR